MSGDAGNLYRLLGIQAAKQSQEKEGANGLFKENSKCSPFCFSPTVLLISDMPICWETPDIWIWSFSMKFSIFKCGELNENIVKHYANKTSLWRRLSPGLDHCRRISPKVICLQELHLHVANPQAEKKSASRAWVEVLLFPSSFPSFSHWAHHSVFRDEFFVGFCSMELEEHGMSLSSALPF